jgi:hypothetical protein
MKIKLALIILLTASTVQAGTPEEACKSYHELATSLMDARQSGVSLVKAMSITDRKFLQDLTIKAYKQPRYRVEENKKRAAEDFANRIYLECYEALSKEK